MGWAKFDDQFTDHPKVVAAGPLAELLAMRAVIHCARYETDGHVQSAQLPRLSLGISSPKKQVAALVRVGLWTDDPDGDGWWVHDFLDYHPSKEEQDLKRAEARNRMARNRAKKDPSSQGSSQDVRANNGRSHAGGSPYPDPTRPVVPNGTEEPSASRKRSAAERATRLPDDWRPEPEPELVKAIGGQAAAKREFEKFRDYWRAKAGKDGRKVDWQATWRNWLRNAGERRGGVTPLRAPRQDAQAARYGENAR
jgi:hypothetical protein